MTSRELALFELVRLVVDQPDNGLKAGDVGTIVETHWNTHRPFAEAFEVEFVDAEGRTRSVATLTREQVEPIR